VGLIEEYSLFKCSSKYHLQHNVMFHLTSCTRSPRLLHQIIAIVVQTERSSASSATIRQYLTKVSSLTTKIEEFSHLKTNNNNKLSTETRLKLIITSFRILYHIIPCLIQRFRHRMSNISITKILLTQGLCILQAPWGLLFLLTQGSYRPFKMTMLVSTIWWKLNQLTIKLSNSHHQLRLTSQFRVEVKRASRVRGVMRAREAAYL
jgi:hypothetical protein